VGNLMVDLKPTNVKLRDRAVRIVKMLTGANDPAALAALEKKSWVIKDAVALLKKKVRSRSL
jgi:N-acetylmuramic acid 6-phosphate (MurNAc-6-P) etherase